MENFKIKDLKLRIFFSMRPMEALSHQPLNEMPENDLVRQNY